MTDRPGTGCALAVMLGVVVWAGGFAGAHVATAEPTGAIGTALIGGKATWYDDGSGYYGAAGPVLREALGGDPAFRGQTVRVCADECVLVRLTDWCACGDRGGVPTLIDLSPDAFARLAPLSAGVIDVTIELGGVVLPPTDTEGVQ
jgi:hypothetical protein